MKNFSNYYPSYNERIIADLKRSFQKQLDEGDTVDIDTQTNIKVVIQEHQNPLNENKEDRKLLVPNTVSIHTGSIVTWNSEKWMIYNQVSEADNNGVYYVTRILACNNHIKYILPSDKTTIVDIPAISGDLSLYGIGVVETKQMTEIDSKKSITIPYTNQTKEIYEGQRFYFPLENKCYMVSQIVLDNLGLITLKMKFDELRDEDNLNGSGLAWNEGLTIITNTSTPSTNVGYAIEIIGSDTIVEGYTEDYTIKLWNNGVIDNTTSHVCDWSLIDSNNLAQLTGNIKEGHIVDDTVQLKGLNATNIVKIRALFGLDGYVIAEKNVLVKSMI